MNRKPREERGHLWKYMCRSGCILGPGGPMVTGKDWAKSLSLPLFLSLSLSPLFSRCVLVFKSCVSRWLFCVVSQFCRPYTRLFHSRFVWLELLWCSRYFRCGRFFRSAMLCGRCLEGHECSLSCACSHLFCVKHIFTSPSLALPVALLQESVEISF